MKFCIGILLILLPFASAAPGEREVLLGAMVRDPPEYVFDRAAADAFIGSPFASDPFYAGSNLDTESGRLVRSLLPVLRREAARTAAEIERDLIRPAGLDWLPLTQMRKNLERLLEIEKSRVHRMAVTDLEAGRIARYQLSQIYPGFSESGDVSYEHREEFQRLKNRILLTHETQRRAKPNDADIVRRWVQTETDRLKNAAAFLSRKQLEERLADPNGPRLVVMPFEDLTKSRFQDSYEIYLLDQEVQALNRDQIARSEGVRYWVSNFLGDPPAIYEYPHGKAVPILSLDGQDLAVLEWEPDSKKARVPRLSGVLRHLMGPEEWRRRERLMYLHLTLNKINDQLVLLDQNRSNPSSKILARLNFDERASNLLHGFGINTPEYVPSLANAFTLPEALLESSVNSKQASLIYRGQILAHGRGYWVERAKQAQAVGRPSIPEANTPEGHAARRLDREAWDLLFGDQVGNFKKPQGKDPGSGHFSVLGDAPRFFEFAPPRSRGKPTRLARGKAQVWVESLRSHDTTNYFLPIPTPDGHDLVSIDVDWEAYRGRQGLQLGQDFHLVRLENQGGYALISMAYTSDLRIRAGFAPSRKPSLIGAEPALEIGPKDWAEVEGLLREAGFTRWLEEVPQAKNPLTLSQSLAKSSEYTYQPAQRYGRDGVPYENPFREMSRFLVDDRFCAQCSGGNELLTRALKKAYEKNTDVEVSRINGISYQGNGLLSPGRAHSVTRVALGGRQVIVDGTPAGGDESGAVVGNLFVESDKSSESSLERKKLSRQIEEARFRLVDAAIERRKKTKIPLEPDHPVVRMNKTLQAIEQFFEAKRSRRELLDELTALWSIPFHEKDSTSRALTRVAAQGRKTLNQIQSRAGEFLRRGDRRSKVFQALLDPGI
ncbi:MAG: hypothetical protein AAB425_11710, partial [Bdellovibrionota bacterium]